MNTMRTVRSFIIVTLVLGVFILFQQKSVFAVVEGCADGDLGCIDAKSEEYRKKIAELKGEQNTLSSAVAYIDNKRKLTENEMKKTELEILTLKQEVAMLSDEIGKLEVSLDVLSQTFVTEIRNEYKHGSFDPFLAFLKSESVEEYVLTYKSSQRVQKRLHEIMQYTETQRIVYGQQKDKKEVKQKELAALQKKLEVQKKDLITQQTQKQTLLDQTRNDEKKYQALLAQAQSEKRALEEALISGTKVGPVKRGDSIALVGNSGYPGCSTGEHLHFEVQKDRHWVDPGSYLKSRQVSDEERGGTSSLGGGGDWDWPLSDTIRLTQHFGQTPWSWRYKYSGGIHTGYDMVSTSSKVIRAPADGTLYSSSQKCGGSTINIKYIEHNDGVISFYLHVQ